MRGEGPNDKGPTERGRRGRPPGSVRLTKEIARTIVSYIRAGAFDHAAAEAAGISVRTFHDWIARGEDRHPSRPCTRELRAFADGVRRARAEARVAAESRMHELDPGHWLCHVARGTPELQGWSDPEEGEGASELMSHFTPEQIRDQARRLDRAIHASGERPVPRCPHPRCRCPNHRVRPQDAEAPGHRH